MKKVSIITVLVIMSLTTNAHAWWYKEVTVTCPISTSQELMVVATKAIRANNGIGLNMLINTSKDMWVLYLGQKVHILEKETYAGIKMAKVKVKKTGKVGWTFLKALD